MCPIGMFESICVVLWEEYGSAIKKGGKYITLFVLAAANLILWW